MLFPGFVWITYSRDYLGMLDTSPHDEVSCTLEQLASFLEGSFGLLSAPELDQQGELVDALREVSIKMIDTDYPTLLCCNSHARNLSSGNHKTCRVAWKCTKCITCTKSVFTTIRT